MRADTMLPLKSDTGDESQMSIYTKRGDKGITDMARTRNISKSDDRIRLSGAIDELNSHIGLMISMISSQETVISVDEKEVLRKRFNFWRACRVH